MPAQRREPPVAAPSEPGPQPGPVPAPEPGPVPADGRPVAARVPLPPDEDRRLRTLYGYGVLDSERDARFEDLVAEVARDCDVPIATITFVDSARQWFKASVGIDLEETARDVALCAYTILEADRPMVIPDTTLDSRFRENPLVVGDPGLMAYAGAPIVAPDGTVMGTVCAMDTEPHAYTQGELDALARVSRRVVELLEDSRVAQRLAQGATLDDVSIPSGVDASLSLTRPLIEAIGEDLDVVALIEEFCRSVLVSFGWWAARVAWVQGDTLQPGEWQVAPGGPAALAPLAGRGAAPTALDDLSVAFSEATMLDVSMLRWISDRDVLASLGARHAVVIDVPGAASLAARLVFLVPTARALDATANRTLTTATAVLPRVIVQQRARQELTYRATHDALTGLLNREGLLRVHPASGDDAFALRRALLFIDIDDFKRINDTQGHRAGDELLIRLARLLGVQIRPTDTVVRLGGDEFVVVLEGIEQDEEIVRIARRLLRALCGRVTLLRTMQVETSISIGAVRWTGGSLETALEAADRLMYSAKELGGARAALDGASGRLVLGPDEGAASDLDDALDGAVDIRMGAIVGFDADGRPTVQGARVRAASSLRHPDVNALMRAIQEALPSTFPASGAGVLRFEFSKELWETEGLVVRLLVGLRERLPGIMLEAAIGADAVGAAHALEAAIAVRDGLGLPIVLTGFGVGRGELSLVDRLAPAVIELDPGIVAAVRAIATAAGSAGPAPLPGALVAARALAADRGLALSAAGDAGLLEPAHAPLLATLVALCGLATFAVLAGTGQPEPVGRGPTSDAMTPVRERTP